MSIRPVRLAIGSAGVLLTLASIAGFADGQAGWSGPGWYQVLQTTSGPRLVGGPYKNELACKKAMNLNQPDRACKELSAPPAGGR